MGGQKGIPNIKNRLVKDVIDQATPLAGVWNFPVHAPEEKKSIQIHFSIELSSLLVLASSSPYIFMNLCRKYIL